MTKDRSLLHAKIKAIVKYKAKIDSLYVTKSPKRNTLQNVLPEMMKRDYI